MAESPESAAVSNLIASVEKTTTRIDAAQEISTWLIEAWNDRSVAKYPDDEAIDPVVILSGLANFNAIVLTAMSASDDQRRYLAHVLSEATNNRLDDTPLQQ